jgi:hypothetical protein
VRVFVSRELCSLAMILATAGGCREPAPSAGGPFGDRVAEYAPKIEKALGVTFKTPPKVEVRTRDQVRQFLLERLNEPVVQNELRGQTATYRVLGLIHDTLDLQKFFVPLLTEQIIGYYDPKTKVLYVVQGAPEEYVGLTIMHELVHALQDQYVNLDSIQHVVGNDDVQAAAQAVIEGQATYQTAAMMVGPANIAAALPSGWETIRASIRDAQASQPVFSAAPMVIQESLLFPYINGADFIRRYQLRRTGPFAFDSMPVSTEQVLHDTAYFATPPERPTTVVLPTVAGKIYENTMGEFGTRLFLFRHLRLRGDTSNASIRDAATAAAGWGGDRFATVRTAAGDGIAWVSVWDTPVDAAQFVSALDQALVNRYGVTAAKSDAGRRYATRARTALVTTRDLDGRTVVLYVDVPSGASTSVLDLAQVTLR